MHMLYAYAICILSYACIAHPADPRYKKIIGLNAIIPGLNLAIPIIGSKWANPQIGTGLELVSAYSSDTDFAILRDLGIKAKKCLL